MKRLQEAKRNKLHSSHSIDSNAISSVAGPSEPVTESPEVPELSVSTLILSMVSLDESLRVSIDAAQLSDDASYLLVLKKIFCVNLELQECNNCC